MRRIKRGPTAIGVLLAVLLSVYLWIPHVGAQQISTGGVLDTLANYVVNGAWTFLNGFTIGGTNNGSGPGYANSDRFKVYRVDSILDAVATDIFTVTVPNGSHAAVIPVVIMTALGAGGSVGEWECVGSASGQIVVERFSGANLAKNTGTLVVANSACNSNATTITTTYGTSTVTGAATVTQTFTMQLTISRGGSSSTNHHAIVRVDVLNAVQSGITIS